MQDTAESKDKEEDKVSCPWVHFFLGCTFFCVLCTVLKTQRSLKSELCF